MQENQITKIQEFWNVMLKPVQLAIVEAFGAKNCAVFISEGILKFLID